MNRNQEIVLCVAVVLILGMCLYVPEVRVGGVFPTRREEETVWEHGTRLRKDMDPVRRRYEIKYGRGLRAAYDWRYYMSTRHEWLWNAHRVNLSVLGVQILAVIVPAAGLIYMLRTKRGEGETA